MRFFRASSGVHRVNVPIVDLQTNDSCNGHIRGVHTRSDATDAAMDHEPAQTAWVVPATLGVGTAFGQILAVDPWTSTFFARIAWWPGAILMCGLLASPRARWPLCCGAALLGSALVCVSMGRDLLPYCVRLAGE